ncbi:hypothetical protein ACLH09_05550 [Citrobacter braakii]|uniref:hypothetical protein n=1 Tax=Citrobacter braakii TaxID=57706 RepID=UPI003984102A
MDLLSVSFGGDVPVAYPPVAVDAAAIHITPKLTALNAALFQRQIFKSVTVLVGCSYVRSICTGAYERSTCLITTFSGTCDVLHVVRVPLPTHPALLTLLGYRMNYQQNDSLVSSASC